MGKGQKGEELWELRLDSDLDFSDRVLTRNKGYAMLDVLKVQIEFRRGSPLNNDLDS